MLYVTQIEIFHKIIEVWLQRRRLEVETAERLVNLMATFCIRVGAYFWMTMLNRSAEAMRAAFRHSRRSRLNCSTDFDRQKDQ